jgi:hypothetical protein
MVPMLERYKRTFLVTQVVIVAITAAIFVRFHVWQAAATFFLAMQLGAIAGSAWGARIKRKIERSQGFVALR